MTFKNYLISQGTSEETQRKYYQNLVDYINWTEQENIESEQSTTPKY